MLRSELISRLAQTHVKLGAPMTEKMVDTVLDMIANTIGSDGRVELRGFGAFTCRVRDARVGRNPRTGESVDIEEKRTPFFKAGKEMRERLNAS